MVGLIILGVIVFVLGGFLIKLYNGLITLRNKVEEAWSDIDVQLKRRYDLIPNLVETVKAYAKHESTVFEKVTKARNLAIKYNDEAKNAKGQEEVMKKSYEAEKQLSGALASLFAVAENYPDLKADRNFSSLQSELAETENKIEKSRRYYNGTVRDFNTKVQIFPNNLVAGIFGFKQRAFYEVEDEKQRENVKVSF
ncbi:MAG: LemA family protein [Candidatus Moranbacteria bacterium]|nr:LemA family protein [Candidatus Moranbacteria bacterium]